MVQDQEVEQHHLETNEWELKSEEHWLCSNTKIGWLELTQNSMQKKLRCERGNEREMLVHIHFCRDDILVGKVDQLQ